MEFNQGIEEIVKEDPRYSSEAYEFVNEALAYTCTKLERPRHVTGQELLQGIREYALKKFGPMARFMINNWGVSRCEDFGRIVFNMVERGLLGKTENDRLEDFNGGYDFEEAFDKPFKT